MAWDSDTRWKALDLFVKATAGALIAAAVALFGYWMQEEQRRAAEENSQLRALVEFNSAQKTLDVNVGMQLLSKFVDYYLKPAPESLEANRQTLLMLRLLSLNFQDVPINLKPLFEDLDKRLRNPARHRRRSCVISSSISRRKSPTAKPTGSRSSAAFLPSR